ncbi:MAG TPA: zf-HC2 domain-containing protein [Gaiellaceae bacterium]|jgi:predicted anti-sigma-YlaC factor YlaD
MSVRRLSARSGSCETIRTRISQALDGEASELELAAIRAHVSSCPACAVFQDDVAILTHALRDAPPAIPSTVAWTGGQRRRSSRGRLVAVGAAAAAVAVSLTLGGIVGSLRSGGSPANASASRAIAATAEPYYERHVLAMLTRPRPPAGRTIAV